MFNRRFNNKKRSFPRQGNGKNRIKYLSNESVIKAVSDSANLSVEKEVPYVSSLKFDELNISQLIKNNIKQKGYVEATHIQDKAIPEILNGKDVIGIANTGTGKTAAFLIPLIDKVIKNKTQKVLIIAPTRELAFQIQDEFISLARSTGIFSALLIGGKNMFGQKRDLQRSPNFVIGTPGRIKDLINQRAFNLSQFNNVVLDEADRMVDIGFINEIKFFISMLPRERQSLFFSATISGKVSEIISGFVKNPITISVKKNDVTQNVKQEVVQVRGGDNKIELLHDLLIKKEFDKVLIFGRTKHGVEKLYKQLIERGFNAEAIHGDKKQSQRQSILNRFKNCETKILLATDVVSRGLDIREVSQVINYELPETYEDYVHRIGRTGRADKTGVAITFLKF